MGKAPNDRKQAGGYAAPLKIDSRKSAEKLANAARVAIFEVDGVVYDMPAAPRADLALAYLEKAQHEGEDAAAFYLITATIGAEGYAALRNVEGLDDEVFEGVMLRIKAVALPKGSQPGTTKG